MIKLRKILLYDWLYILLFCLVTGYALIYTKIVKLESKYNVNDSLFEITLTNYQIDGNKLTIEGKEKEKIVGTYYFETEEEKNSFNKKYNLGDLLLIEGTLNVPTNNTIPNTFNYKKYLYNNKIFHTLSIDKISLKKSNTNLLYKIKNYTYKRIDKLDTIGYHYAFIIGEKSYIDSNINKSFSKNGISHLFALSGLHVGILSLIISKFLKLLKINELSRVFIIFIFLILFCFITGFSPSILRATIFTFLIGINKYYTFFIKNENLLILTYIILVIINPYMIYMLGFLLSFTITYFILISQGLIKTNNKILSILYVSIISFISSFPIIIYNFYEVNLLGILLNIFFVPYVSSIVYPLTLVSFILPNKLLNYSLNILEYTSLIVSKTTSLTLIFSKISIIGIIVYYILLIILIKYNFKPSICLLILLGTYWYIKPYLNNNTYIYYLDVSQGDSVLILSKNAKEVAIIDTGGKLTYKIDKWKEKNNIYSLSESLITFYKSLGIKQINTMILTHGDDDHSGEAINIINNFKVEKVIFNCGSFNNLEQSLIKALEKKKIKYYSCIKELNISTDKLEFLNTKEYNNENNDSNVIYLNHNNVKFLFMGDAGIDREKDILNSYVLKNIDFLKIGHHGSNTSSSKQFIDSINSKNSIISVGKNNRYGHPKDEVLDTLKNSKIYRTDLDGSIEIKLNKDGYKIRTCPP